MNALEKYAAKQLLMQKLASTAAVRFALARVAKAYPGFKAWAKTQPSLARGGVRNMGGLSSGVEDYVAAQAGGSKPSWARNVEDSILTKLFMPKTTKRSGWGPTGRQVLPGIRGSNFGGATKSTRYSNLRDELSGATRPDIRGARLRRIRLKMGLRPMQRTMKQRELDTSLTGIHAHRGGFFIPQGKKVREAGAHGNFTGDYQYNLNQLLPGSRNTSAPKSPFLFKGIGGDHGGNLKDPLRQWKSGTKSFASRDPRVGLGYAMGRGNPSRKIRGKVIAFRRKAVKRRGETAHYLSDKPYDATMAQTAAQNRAALSQAAKSKRPVKTSNTADFDPSVPSGDSPLVLSNPYYEDVIRVPGLGPPGSSRGVWRKRRKRAIASVWNIRPSRRVGRKKGKIQQGVSIETQSGIPVEKIMQLLGRQQ